MVIYIGVTVDRPRPTDGELLLYVLQQLSVAERPVARAAVVVRRPRPIGGKTTAECIVTVGGSRTCCCCFPVNSCWRSPPGVRAGLSLPLPIYAGVVVLLPCPTGGKFVAECIVAATGALPPPRWVPIDGCSSRPSDGRARTSSAVATG